MTDIEPLVYLREEEIDRRDIIKPEEQQVLDFINLKIAAGNSLEEILDFLFKEMQKLIPVNRIGLAFFEENGSRMVLHHTVADYSPLLLGKGYTADAEGSSLQKVFDDETPRVLNDLEAYYAQHPGSESTRLLMEEEILSSMTCPLKVERRAVGLLFFSSKQKNAYTEHGIRLHLAVSERLSQAVEKTWRINQLAGSINAYMEMLGFVTHELKSPLDSLITLGNTLADGYLGKLDPKHEDYVRRMISKAQYLRNMTGEYLTLSRFESDRLEINAEKTDFIKDILEDALDIVAPQVEEKEIKLITEAENLTSLNCDKTLIKIVVNNLLSNGVKYGDNEGTVKVKASQKDEAFTFSVENTGPGFSPDQKHRLFKRFSRLESKELMQRKGSGIGLYTSWKIIQLHHGTIKGESEEGKWARFTFTIPLDI